MCVYACVFVYVCVLCLLCVYSCMCRSLQLYLPVSSIDNSTQDPDAPVDYNVDYFIPKHGSTTPPYYAQMIQLWTSHKPTRAKQSGPRRGLLELNTANFRTPATAVHCFHNASLALPRHSSYRDPTPRLFPSRFAHVVRTLLSLDHPEPIRVPLAPKGTEIERKEG